MKRLLYLLCLALFFTACKSTTAIATSEKEKPKEKLSRSEKRKTNQLAEQLIDTATENLGIRYKYAGTSKTGFDCSGLVYTVYNSENINLPRNSFQQSKIGIVLDPKEDEAQKGDLIFFKTNRNRQINHVGIVIEVHDKEIKFIHASTSRGVIISSTNELYYKSRFIQVNRVL